MDKLDALKFFIIASETLNFREAAIKLSVSPSVVTRTVAELEKQLGEPLFKRNTRSIFLTSFGELFLQTAKDDNEMKGIVRITLLRFPNHEQILYELLTALRPYPELFIDWRLDMMKLDTIEHRIDIGIRVGREPNPNFIIKNIGQVEHILVASPELIERLGAPTDLEDLRQRYPFSGLINPETGKSFEFMSDAVNTFVPRHIEFYTTDPYAEIQAALAGRTVVQSSDFICREYLASGQLVPPLPELRQEKWQFYLYRPYQLITPKRVTVVFSLLEKILRKYFASK